LPRESRIPELDGFRGLAIALVLYEHFVPRAVTSPGWLMAAIHPTRPLGGIGVGLFFVLSGFLIGGILMDHRRAENYFKAFYARRACRILPIYFLTVAAFAFVKWLLRAHGGADWYGELFLRGGMPVWANLTFTQNFVQVFTLHANPDWLIVNWSLVLEEQLYLLLPLALWLLPPQAVIRVCVGLMCAHPFCQLYLCLWHPIAYVRLNGIYPMQADALLMGVVCAYAVRQAGFRAWLAGWRAPAGLALAVLLAGAVLAIPFSGRTQYEYENILFFSPWLTVLFGALLLSVVLERGRFAGPWLRWRPLGWLGAISYGVYLFHLPVNGLMHGLVLGRDYRYHDWADVVVGLAAVAVTLLLAAGSWHLFEKRIVAWSHSFRYGENRAAET
jgi:peptidoglycan/LPS O-acetylase OafA/YrhL